mmetsp:Transcript_9526/g.23202  ORF Transcript_9526/g.23202 Transcript_9526/m.23202 type:complete len:320 (+) Transcript_9526:2312-3271(+)
MKVALAEQNGFALVDTVGIGFAIVLVAGNDAMQSLHVIGHDIGQGFAKVDGGADKAHDSVRIFQWENGIEKDGAGSGTDKDFGKARHATALGMRYRGVEVEVGCNSVVVVVAVIVLLLLLGSPLSGFHSAINDTLHQLSPEWELIQVAQKQVGIGKGILVLQKRCHDLVFAIPRRVAARIVEAAIVVALRGVHAVNAKSKIGPPGRGWIPVLLIERPGVRFELWHLFGCHQSHEPVSGAGAHGGDLTGQFRVSSRSHKGPLGGLGKGVGPRGGEGLGALEFAVHNGLGLFQRRSGNAFVREGGRFFFLAAENAVGQVPQ